jgi:hypothetical protein
MNGSVNALNWFEISVSDIARAKKFYEAVFNITMYETEMMGMKMAFFPAEQGNGKVSGGLVQGEGYTPSTDGAKIYFNGNPDLSGALNRVEGAGGRVLMPKTHISPEIGYMAFFMDSEGNAVALHSSN